MPLLFKCSLAIQYAAAASRCSDAVQRHQTSMMLAEDIPDDASFDIMSDEEFISDANLNRMESLQPFFEAKMADVDKNQCQVANQRLQDIKRKTAEVAKTTGTFVCRKLCDLLGAHYTEDDIRQTCGIAYSQLKKWIRENPKKFKAIKITFTTGVVAFAVVTTFFTAGAVVPVWAMLCVGASSTCLNLTLNTIEAQANNEMAIHDAAILGSGTVSASLGFANTMAPLIFSPLGVLVPGGDVVIPLAIDIAINTAGVVSDALAFRVSRNTSTQYEDRQEAARLIDDIFKRDQTDTYADYEEVQDTDAIISRMSSKNIILRERSNANESLDRTFMSMDGYSNQSKFSHSPRQRSSNQTGCWLADVLFGPCLSAGTH